MVIYWRIGLGSKGSSQFFLDLLENLKAEEMLLVLFYSAQKRTRKLFALCFYDMIHGIQICLYFLRKILRYCSPGIPLIFQPLVYFTISADSVKNISLRSLFPLYPSSFFRNPVLLHLMISTPFVKQWIFLFGLIY